MQTADEFHSASPRRRWAIPPVESANLDYVRRRCEPFSKREPIARWFDARYRAPGRTQLYIRDLTLRRAIREVRKHSDRITQRR